MSHIEKAKAEINEHLAVAYEHRGDPIMHHSRTRAACEVVLRTLVNETLTQPGISPFTLRLLQNLAKKTLEAVEKLDNGERARLD